MLSPGSGQRYYLYRAAVDLRKSFNGLQGIVTNQMKRAATGGEVFIFLNRRRDAVKLLVWDRTGFVIWYKRLEAGRFELPAAPPAGGADPGQTLPWTDLILILEGLSPAQVRRRKRYEAPGSENPQ